MKKKGILIILIVIVIFIFVGFGNKNKVFIKTPNNNYSVILADTDEKRITGLSGTTELSNKDVMLFVFEKEDMHGIWMKDMLINIDIVFLDSEMNVINYYDDVAPSTYPTIFYPERNALYVLEMASGERVRSGLDKNTKVYYK